MKKGVFTVANYFAPKRGVLSMHCSATADKKTGASSRLFGLSGTGKTTLSADPKRHLIGDDEHCWSDDGIFNIEGGLLGKGDQPHVRERAGHFPGATLWRGTRKRGPRRGPRRGLHRHQHHAQHARRISDRVHRERKDPTNAPSLGAGTQTLSTRPSALRCPPWLTPLPIPRLSSASSVLKYLAG